MPMSLKDTTECAMDFSHPTTLHYFLFRNVIQCDKTTPCAYIPTLFQIHVSATLLNMLNFTVLQY